MPLNDGPVTLLVVDDEEAICNALRKFLVQQGFEVATASSGEEALLTLQRQKITGMLLDVNMPGISGVDLVPQIMEIEPTIALLMLTAVNDATSAALCMQRGAYDYLIKPIDLGHLSRAIHHALQRRHTQLESQQINQWLKEEVASRVTERRLEQANQERISDRHPGSVDQRPGSEGPVSSGTLGPGRRSIRHGGGGVWLPGRAGRGGSHRRPAA